MRRTKNIWMTIFLFSDPHYDNDHCGQNDNTGQNDRQNKLFDTAASLIMFDVYNTGKTTLYNVWVKFEGDSISGGDSFLGTISSGATGPVPGRSQIPSQ